MPCREPFDHISPPPAQMGDRIELRRRASASLANAPEGAVGMVLGARRLPKRAGWRLNVCWRGGKCGIVLWPEEVIRRF